MGVDGFIFDEVSRQFYNFDRLSNLTIAEAFNEPEWDRLRRYRKDMMNVASSADVVKLMDAAIAAWGEDRHAAQCENVRRFVLERPDGRFFVATDHDDHEDYEWRDEGRYEEVEPERETKQVIVMRKDLGMRKGKMVAQGAHASLKALLDTGVIGHVNGDYELMPEPMRLWLDGSFTKICVSVASEEELVVIYERAREQFNSLVPMALIIDSGRTEFKGVPTKTCCAIGPWWADEIDEITGKLPLL